MVSPDGGLGLLRQVTEWGKAHSIAVVNGSVSDTLEAIHLELDTKESVGLQLCAYLDDLRPYLIVTRVSSLTSEEIDESVNNLMARGADESELAATRGCAQFIGNVALLNIHIFIKDCPLPLNYTYVAPWCSDAYQDGLDDDVGDPQDLEEEARFRAEREERERRDREEQAERDKWTPDVRTKAARQIASDPRFPKAKTEAARVFLSRAVLGPDVPSDDYMVKEISREAKAIFDFEIAPDK